MDPIYTPTYLNLELAVTISLLKYQDAQYYYFHNIIIP